MELTATERKIVESYRQGADIKMLFFYAYTYEEVIQLLEGFRIRHIVDLDTTIAFAGYDTSEREIGKTVYLSK